jgi:hypothetical protein
VHFVRPGELLAPRIFFRGESLLNYAQFVPGWERPK